MADLEHVFVYGTLCRGECREDMWPTPIDRIQPAFVLGELYDLGAYPAMIAGQDFVAGELRFCGADAMATTLAVLDEIEGYQEGRSNNLYKRIVVSATVISEFGDVQPIPAYAYQMQAAQLPKSARRIQARHFDAVSGRQFCKWPDDGRSQAERDCLPDPFPDW